jgi:hypothetical protein
MIYINEPVSKLNLRHETGVQGKIQCSIVDSRTKRVLKTYPWQKNLILQQGLDYIGSNGDTNSAWANHAWRACCAGSGTTVTELTGGANTAAVSSGQITVSTTGFLAGNSSDVGKTFKIGSQSYLVTVFDSTTQATVTPAINVSAAAFTLYYTNQTALTTELKRTVTYLTGAGNCGSTKSTNNMQCFRTFDFAAESGPVAYNEIGFSPIATAGSNLFSRIKLASTINLTSGQQLRVKYQVEWSFSPVTQETIGTSPITGWTGATGKQQLLYPCVRPVKSTGSANGDNTSDVGWTGFPANVGYPVDIGLLPASLLCQLFGIFTTSATQTFWNATALDNNSGLISNHAPSQAAYVTGNFYKELSTTWSVAEANVATIREIRLTGQNNTTMPCFQYIIDSAQTKDNLHTLTLTVRFSWARVL